VTNLAIRALPSKLFVVDEGLDSSTARAIGIILCRSI
jgi:hypothetical protein